MADTKPLPILRVRDENGNEYPIPAVGIMGPKGDRGEPGPAGSAGPVGPVGPTGADGKQGPPGQPGMPGAYYTPYVHQIDADKIQFDFQGSSYGIPPVMPVSVTLPAGKDGAIGPQGPAGSPGGIGPVGPQGPCGADGKQGPPGKPGDPGKDAPTPALSIGTVETLAPGSQATAEMTGPITDRKLNLGIPQGKDGSGGTGGPLKPLTFTGVVSAEYDGTQPVSVEIPAGGGGGTVVAEKLNPEFPADSNYAIENTFWDGPNFFRYGRIVQAQFSFTVNNPDNSKYHAIVKGLPGYMGPDRVVASVLARDGSGPVRLQLTSTGTINAAGGERGGSSSALRIYDCGFCYVCKE